MRSYKLTLCDLKKKNACDRGLELFFRIAPSGTLLLPPEGQTWTVDHWKLADAMLRTTGHHHWMLVSNLWFADLAPNSEDDDEYYEEDEEDEDEDEDDWDLP